MKTLILALVIFCSQAIAQTSAGIARHVQWGSSLPAKCSPTTGDIFAVVAGGAATYYNCTAADTWTQAGGTSVPIDSTAPNTVGQVWCYDGVSKMGVCTLGSHVCYTGGVIDICTDSVPTYSSGTVVPGSCTIAGAQLFYKTDAAIGSQWYGCNGATFDLLATAGSGVSSGATLPATCSVGTVYLLTAVYSSQGAYFYNPGLFHCPTTNTWVSAAGRNLLVAGVGAPMLGPSPNASNTTTAMNTAINVIMCHPFESRDTIKLTTVRGYIGTGDSGKYLGVNIYDSSMNLIGPATTTGISAAVGAAAFTLNNMIVGPGSFFYCMVSDGTATRMLGITDANGVYHNTHNPDTTKRQFACNDGSHNASLATTTWTWPSTCGTRGAVSFPNDVYLGVTP